MIIQVYQSTKNSGEEHKMENVSRHRQGHVCGGGGETRAAAALRQPPRHATATPASGGLLPSGRLNAVFGGYVQRGGARGQGVQCGYQQACCGGSTTHEHHTVYRRSDSGAGTCSPVSKNLRHARNRH
ncbi:hypothetical protein GWK47_038705 [Chionoecetes opilio]|uniref:Uncharacterized protein n=1 Tax=Chionoecetes opilio TaxID=41210 RepID=A0A8J5CLZ2_CHIOP|nr:hypothetical protein GWK47_038705 [Chionoecetes opilio]